ncbi:SDR family oxidoreductase [Streptomyces sp. NBC_00096]|uniref:SDR family oxidoreductase n=1 Tax=Streptomyces sp. NBC_00096 TaxID=2975650 RepID=UPI00386F47FF
MSEVPLNADTVGRMCSSCAQHGGWGRPDSGLGLFLSAPQCEPARAEARLARSGTPLRRVGQREEVASVVAFLASEDSSYVSGQTLYINGGAH